MSTRVTTSFDVRRVEQAYFAALKKSARRSRQFVEQVCSSWQWDESIDLAVLLVSELAANAINASDAAEVHPSGLQRIGVRLLELEDSLVIEVWDTAPGPPLLLEPSEESEQGRGLQLVDAFSIRWGYYDVATGGKAVWCQLGRGDAADVNEADGQAEFQYLQGVLQALVWD